MTFLLSDLIKNAPAGILTKLPVRRVNELRLSPYAALPSLALDRWERLVDHVPGCDSNQVRGDRNRLFIASYQ